MPTNRKIFLHPVVNGVEDKTVNLCPRTTWDNIYGIPEDFKSLYTFKGSVPTYQNLPTNVTKTGWVYNVQDTGMNYASVYENATLTWDALGAASGVSDVQLGSTSVVSGGVAHINAGDGITLYQNEIAVKTGEGLFFDSNDAVCLNAATRNTLAQVANKSTVSVSASGTATDEISYITVNGTEKKIASGGLPSGTTAGQAMIWNGSQWSLTSGYGYEESGGGSGTVFEWDGDTTGRSPITVSIGDPGEETDYTLYLMTSTIPYTEVNKDDFIGGLSTVSYDEEGEQFDEEMEIESVNDMSEWVSNTAHSYNIDAGDAVILVIAYDNATLSGVSLQKGVYAGYYAEEGFTAFVKKLTTPGASNNNNETIVHQIDSKFIPSELPIKVNDRYLHTNASTGALEWSTVSGGQTYTAGSGIEITNNVISADLTYSDFNSITNVLTNLTATGDLDIEIGGTANVTLVANNGYGLPSSISVSGASYTYNNSTGAIVLSNTTGNVTITASGVQQLEAPTISISGSTLTIPDVTNATSYDLYVDGVYNSNIPKASGYTVNIQFTSPYSLGTHVIINGAEVGTGYLEQGSNTFTGVRTIRLYSDYTGWEVTNATGNFTNGDLTEIDLTLTQDSSCSMEEYD